VPVEEPVDTEEHCYCKRPYHPDEFMIGCDGGCERWFHGAWCVSYLRCN
jgi:hypothetical protein